MNRFTDKIAIVTGGASGIGRALCEALAREGAEVIVADLAAAKAVEVAEGIVRAGGKAAAEALDVCDAAAFRALVEGVAARAGRIDYLFNNAGIAINGEVRDITLEDWKQVLDVDLDGVVHGVTAAYPIMVAQGAGHIINTASLAGLIPAPGITPYGAAKHGVVGLSRSLRAEGADLGVRVSAVCPGFIETPILYQSRAVNVDTAAAIEKLIPVKPMSAEDCAQVILKGVEHNRALILVTWHAKLAWAIDRLAPGLVDWIARKAVRDMRQFRSSGGGEGKA